MLVTQSGTHIRNNAAQAQCAPRKASWFFFWFFSPTTLKTTVDSNEQLAVHHLITMPCFLGNPCVVTCAQMPLDTNHPPAHTCRSTAAVIDISCQSQSESEEEPPLPSFAFPLGAADAYFLQGLFTRASFFHQINPA